MEEPCRRVIGVSCDIIGPRRNRIFALFLDTILAIDGCMWKMATDEVEVEEDVDFLQV